ncbi:hypothetical protein V8E53_000951 [Lactarius tabidus]
MNPESDLESSSRSRNGTPVVHGNTTYYRSCLKCPVCPQWHGCFYFTIAETFINNYSLKTSENHMTGNFCCAQRALVLIPNIVLPSGFGPDQAILLLPAVTKISSRATETTQSHHLAFTKLFLSALRLESVFARAPSRILTRSGFPCRSRHEAAPRDPGLRVTSHSPRLLRFSRRRKSGSPMLRHHPAHRRRIDVTYWPGLSPSPATEPFFRL